MFICVCIALFFIQYTDLLRHFAFFIMTGQIPFTKIAFHPLLMMALWVIIIPLMWMSRNMVAELFWWTMEIIGEKQQRKLKQSAKLQNKLKQSTKLQSEHVQLYVIVLLDIAQSQDESDTTMTEPALLPAAS